MNPNLGLNGFDNTLTGLSNSMAIYGLIYIVVIIYAIFNYVIVSHALYKISEFLDHPFPYTAWVPSFKILLLVQLSEKPWWWLLFFYLAPVLLWIPILGWFVIPILLLVLLCIIFAEVLNKIEAPSWWWILLVLPIVNLVIWLVLSRNLNKKEQQEIFNS
jgi:hypothetical protein